MKPVAGPYFYHVDRDVLHGMLFFHHAKALFEANGLITLKDAKDFFGLAVTEADDIFGWRHLYDIRVCATTRGIVVTTEEPELLRERKF